MHSGETGDREEVMVVCYWEGLQKGKCGQCQFGGGMVKVLMVWLASLVQRISHHLPVGNI